MKTLFIILSLTGTCHARLGDSLEQCARRYGEVTGRVEVSEHLPRQHVFDWDGIRVAIYLGDDGKCMQVTYSTDVATPLTQDKVRELLALNRGAGTWQRDQSRSKPNFAWENSKQGSRAVFSAKAAQGSTLTITGQNFTRLIKELDWKIRHAPKE